MIGSVVAGRYEIQAELGRGGLGQVYRAHDRTLGRDVALKFMRDDGTEAGPGPGLRQEAEILARLSHPAIVAVHDLGEHDGQLFLVMELVCGIPLSIVAEDRPPEPAVTQRLARLVAEALSHAHEHGIIHRDLSLDNVLVDTAGEPFALTIVDFGLGRTTAASLAEPDGFQCGTPRYLAPEAIRGLPADEQTDIYAFGVCLYRLLAGRFPFEGDHLAGLMYAIQFDEPAGLPATVPVDLAKLVLQCLAKERSARPTGFTEILARLDLIETAAAAIPERRRADSGMGAAYNPYLNRVMIIDPGDFFGRTREVRKIYSRLDAPQPQSISVVGDRRIGKSSLLGYIFNEVNRNLHMRHADSSVFVFMDFQSDVAFEEGRFLGLLMEGLPASCKPRRARENAFTFADLENAVANLNGQGKRLIVLMDEFERITNNECFAQSFFSFLRSLANRYKVAYVTASYADLQTLCYTREIADSPFFNIFSNLPLGPLLPEEAAELVRSPSAREGVPLGAHAERLITYAGLRPMHLQIACSCLFEIASGCGGKEPDWEAFARAFREEIRPHYNFVWNRLSDQERANLAHLAHGQTIPRQHAHLNEDMNLRGLLAPNEGPARIESSAFRDFILEQTTQAGSSLLARFMKRKR